MFSNLSSQRHSHRRRNSNDCVVNAATKLFGAMFGAMLLQLSLNCSRTCENGDTHIISPSPFHRVCQRPLRLFRPWEASKYQGPDCSLVLCFSKPTVAAICTLSSVFCCLSRPTHSHIPPITTFTVQFQLLLWLFFLQGRNRSHAGKRKDGHAIHSVSFALVPVVRIGGILKSEPEPQSEHDDDGDHH